MSRYPWTAPTGRPPGERSSCPHAKNARYIRLETSSSSAYVTPRARRAPRRPRRGTARASHSSRSVARAFERWPRVLADARHRSTQVDHRSGRVDPHPERLERRGRPRRAAGAPRRDLARGGPRSAPRSLARRGSVRARDRSRYPSASSARPARTSARTTSANTSGAVSTLKSRSWSIVVARSRSAASSLSPRASAR